MKESSVENHLVKRVTETGGFVRKVVWPGARGAPDRLVGWPEQTLTVYGSKLIAGERVPFPYEEDRSARHAFIETKRPKKGAEAHQAREHERLRAIGFDVRVLDTIEAVDAFILEMVS